MLCDSFILHGFPMMKPSSSDCFPHILLIACPLNLHPSPILRSLLKDMSWSCTCANLYLMVAYLLPLPKYHVVSSNSIEVVCRQESARPPRRRRFSHNSLCGCQTGRRLLAPCSICSCCLPFIDRKPRAVSLGRTTDDDLISFHPYHHPQKGGR